MVNPAVRAYMELQRVRRRVAGAEAKVEAAYRAYQEALRAYGPCPQHGWHRVALAAREEALAAAIEGYGGVLGQALEAISHQPTADG